MKNLFLLIALMFITAGELIESVTGQTWSEFVEENILVRLDMDAPDFHFNKLDFKKL